MSRTGRLPQLFAHTAEPSITMHPQDAERRGYQAGQLMTVASKRGSLVLPLAISDEVPSGSVFAAMHWNGQFLNSGGINEASIGKVDARSFQPELKHAAVRVEPAVLPWRAVIACRSRNLQALQAELQPLLQACGYAALSLQGRDVLVLRAAAETAMEGWLTLLFDKLALQPGPDVLEYRDARRGVVKRAAWQDGTLRGFVFAGETQGSEGLLANLIEGAPWQGPRLTVFAPRQADAGPRDRVICNCQQVKESQIRRMSEQGASLDELKTTLGCGTVCGSCVPEIKRLCVTPVAA